VRSSPSVWGSRWAAGSINHSSGDSYWAGDFGEDGAYRVDVLERNPVEGASDGSNARFGVNEALTVSRCARAQ